MPESHLGLVLYLIGWKFGASFLDQSGNIKQKLLIAILLYKLTTISLSIALTEFQLKSGTGGGEEGGNFRGHHMFFSRSRGRSDVSNRVLTGGS